MIQQVEFVSAHFNYTEEYVLEHTPSWIQRKYIQAARDKHEDHRRGILETFKGISLLADSLLNKGKGMNEIVPPPFDEFMDQLTVKEEPKNEYVEGEWWLTE